jgi:hypothetical protein
MPFVGTAETVNWMVFDITVWPVLSIVTALRLKAPVLLVNVLVVKVPGVPKTWPGARVGMLLKRV